MGTASLDPAKKQSLLVG